MVNSQLRSAESLPEGLAARARAASDGRLALDVALGIVAALVTAFWRPTGWLILFSAAICFAAFGTWGIADRELGERASKASRALVKTLTAVRIFAVLVGSLAAFLLIFSALGVALGTIIS